MSYKCLAFAGQEDFLSNIVHLSNVGSMLGQRRRRWPNNKTASDQCLVWVVSCIQFSGYINAVNLYSIGYCWPTLDRPRHARFEAEWFFKVIHAIPRTIVIHPQWYLIETFTDLKLCLADAIYNFKFIFCTMELKGLRGMSCQFLNLVWYKVTILQKMISNKCSYF